MFNSRTPASLAADCPPQLFVVIDTEEEFDWNAKQDRNARGVEAMAHIGRVQSIFDQYGIVPCYVVDYAVASQYEGYRNLQHIHSDGRCEIGAHLHPWVNPPYDEILCAKNTYAGNLERDLERTKLRRLRDQLEAVFGERPRAYKAGRYGIGPNTGSILQELGFDIDLSMCPPVDHSADGGPDFSHDDARPFWFGDHSQLLELPVSGAFVGRAGAASRQLYKLAQQCRKAKMPGILSRLNLVDRLMLSPEGYSSAEHIRITRHLYRQGIRTFTWSFHSPSVAPGCTPYVQNQKDLESFLQTFHTYFDFFLGEFGGTATTPTRLRRQLESNA